MAQGEVNRVEVAISEESSWGEAPSSPSESMAHAKQTVVSDTIRADRLVDAVAEVGANAEGDVGIEMRWTDFQKLIEGALGSAFTTLSVTGAGSSGNLQFVNATSKIVGPSGSWNNIQPGTWVKVAGAAQAGNNGIFKVVSKTATDLVLSATLTDENSSTATVTGKWIRNGTTKKSYLYEKRFLDLSKYVYFKGCRVAQMNLEVQSKQILTGSFRLMGKEGITGTSTVAGSSVSASGDDVMNATSNVGTITEGGAALSTAIKSCRIGVNANLRALDAVGNRTAIGINLGRVDVTGMLEAYFEDLALYNKMISHTGSSFSFRVTDPAGKVMIVTIPKLFFTTGNPLAPGINQDVMLPLEFVGIRDLTTSCSIQIDLL